MPSQKRAAVKAMKNKGVSERTACGLAGLSRSVYRYESVKSPEIHLREEIKAIAQKHRRFGYRRIWLMLRRDYPSINLKKIYRIRFLVYQGRSRAAVSIGVLI